MVGCVEIGVGKGVGRNAVWMDVGTSFNTAVYANDVTMSGSQNDVTVGESDDVTGRGCTAGGENGSRYRWCDEWGANNYGEVV